MMKEKLYHSIRKTLLPEYCLPLYHLHFSLVAYAEHIMRNAGLEEAQAGIKIAGKNSNNLRYAEDTTSY